jgi:thioredoxin-like negative regulator of GroEL
VKIMAARCCFLLLVLAAAGPVSAEPPAAAEVKWRFDYHAARLEAMRDGLPLVLDFSTDWCFHCKRLDATTFRDPAVARLLSGKYVPVKLDGNREKALVDALNIQGYPTLVLAGSDGKIYKVIEGYVDAPTFRQELERVLAGLDNPEWMTRACQEAHRSCERHDFVRAMALLRPVLEDKKTRPVQVQAATLMRFIEAQAEKRLAEARELERVGKLVEARAELTQLVRGFPGTPAGEKASQALSDLGERPELKAQQRQQRAGELITLARYDFEHKHYLCCLDRCELLVRQYSDLVEGQEAQLMLDQIRENPNWMAAATEAIGERWVDMQLALAESWIRKGEPHLGMECLRRVVRMAPSPRHVDLAKLRLAQIEEPTKQTQFEKPK